MPPLSRIAVGTVQHGADSGWMLGALYGVLAREGIDVQPFKSRACFSSDVAALPRPTARHLDSWLMTREACLELFVRGSRAADLAVVEGEFHPRSAFDVLGLTGGCATCPRECSEGACLESLCQWLDLPVIAVVDVSKLDGCRLPVRPERLNGIFLDGVPAGREAWRWLTTLESLWDAPVLGMLEAMRRPASVVEAKETRPSDCAMRALTDQLQANLDLPALLRIADQRPLDLHGVEGAAAAMAGWQGGLRSADDDRPPLRIAVAYDEAFHCYFPDTLDLLEARGAVICDFSPLRDEGLPPDVDVVYIGCGSPDRLADRLAENHCMKQAIRSYAESGGRVYAEGGGFAYLCEQLVLPGGRRLPMVGALPAVAARAAQAHTPQASEATLRSDTWLAERGRCLRGYLNTAWRIHPTGKLSSLAAEEPLRNSLVGRGAVIGSRLHLNFAAQPAFLRRFFQPLAAVGHFASR